MRSLLVTLTVVEILLVVAVLVYYLLRIAASLRRTSALLGKVSFGVRAIETQCEVIGPAVLTVNDQLRGVADALADLTDLAEAAAGPATRRR
ncbi:MAG TPA: hypothetical protein VNU26_10855 [Mycobacteriales bacterium]|nr:hypothetical protein [Mycobacteriales bacterium]